MLYRLEQIPPGFLQAKASELHSVLPGPSLIHLPGKKTEPLFVSILLHGNEDVGLIAVQHVLQRYQNETLPRALSLFIGNPVAAKLGARRLENQPDYNRIWPGQHDSDSEESAMMQEITDEMHRKNCFMSIDYHNNTGINPYYSLINKLSPTLIQLAVMFSPTVVYTLAPNGTQSIAFARFCPALTLECGKVDDPNGKRKASEFLQNCLELPEIPNGAIQPRKVDLFHGIAVVKMPQEFTYAVGDHHAQICFRSDLDNLNFEDLVAGTIIANVQPGCDAFLDVWDERNEQVRDEYIELLNNQLIFRKSVIPAMFTLNIEIVRQDCLCYLMERMTTVSDLSFE